VDSHVLFVPQLAIQTKPKQGFKNLRAELPFKIPDFKSGNRTFVTWWELYASGFYSFAIKSYNALHTIQLPFPYDMYYPPGGIFLCHWRDIYH